jgi:hypothetical protein
VGETDRMAEMRAALNEIDRALGSAGLSRDAEVMLAAGLRVVRELIGRGDELQAQAGADVMTAMVDACLALELQRREEAARILRIAQESADPEAEA